MEQGAFNGKRVLVTGASRGIGRAAALAFAGQGARVGIHYHTGLDQARDTLRDMAGTGHALLQADVARPEDARRLIAESLDQLEGLDVLVNNAGIFRAHPIDELDYAAWQQAWADTLGINLLGPANLCYLAARHMMEKGCGHIVNVSSRGAFRGEPQQPAYGASKAALNALTQSLAQALAPHGISVTAVAPGFVQTDMTERYLSGPEGEAIRAQSPLGRVATPEEVAHAILFLASEEAFFATGAILDVNGASYLRT